VSPYGDAIDRSGIIYGIVFSVHALLNLGAAVLRRGDLSPFGIYLIYLISFFPYTSIAYGVVTAIYSSHCWQVSRIYIMWPSSTLLIILIEPGQSTILYMYSGNISDRPCLDKYSNTFYMVPCGIVVERYKD